MATKECPFCGSVKEDGKQFRLAIYRLDQRIAVFPPSENLREIAKAAGKGVFGYINDIVKKGPPDCYLMQEVLDDKGNIISIQRVGESNFITVNGSLVKREIVEGKIPKGIKR